MYIIISDLHLTDGTFDYVDPQNPQNNISHDISHEAFKLFWDEVYRIVDANPNNIKEITLVLLGDIFEMRSTTRWIKSDYRQDGTRKLNHRPWNETANRPSSTCGEILQEILKHNAAAFQYLNLKTIDQLDQNSSLYRLAVDKNITINIEYIPGNHDRVINFHQDDGLRLHIADTLGWSLPPAADNKPRRFNFSISDSRTGILARHGHVYDAIDYYRDDLTPALGAALADLYGRVMYHVQETGDKSLIQFCMDIDNVRPAADRLTWVMSNLPEDPTALANLRSVLLTIIHELEADSDELFDFLTPRLTEFTHKLNFYLKAIVRIIGLFTDKEKFIIKWLKKKILKTMDKVEKRLQQTEDEEPLKEILDDTIGSIKMLGDPKKKNMQQDQDYHYYEEANKEIQESGSTSKLKYIIYGHTHRYKLIPLITLKNGIYKDTMYFNSGTWKNTVQKDLFQLENVSFQKWARMTFIVFFDADAQENKDHVFDVWHGNLKTRDLACPPTNVPPPQ